MIALAAEKEPFEVAKLGGMTNGKRLLWLRSAEGFEWEYSWSGLGLRLKGFGLEWC